MSVLPTGFVLVPQEIPLDDQNSRYRFEPSHSKPFVATRAAIETFTVETVAACLSYLQEQARQYHGIDHLQVFENVATKKRLWIIEDDEGGAITALLPSDY